MVVVTQLAVVMAFLYFSRVVPILQKNMRSSATSVTGIAFSLSAELPQIMLAVVLYIPTVMTCSVSRDPDNVASLTIDLVIILIHGPPFFSVFLLSSAN